MPTRGMGLPANVSSVMHAYVSGQSDLAEAAACAVLAVDANNVTVLALMARIHEERGDRAGATTYWMRAANAPGATALEWNNFGLILIGNRDIMAASIAFENAIRLDPFDTRALNNLALTSQELGDFAKAQSCLQEAVRLQPNFATAQSNLGHLYRQFGHYTEAIQCYEAALAADPNSADAANGLGMVVHEQGDVDRAAEYYKQALKIYPQYADASNNLATTYKERGRLDEALAQFEFTLTLAPNHPHTIYNLSQFAAEGRYRFAEAELARIRGLVAADMGTPLERSLLCFSIAAVYDAAHADDDAFKYYRLANEFRKQSRTPGTGFNAAKHNAMINRIMAIYDAEYFQSVRGWGSPSTMPIFIVGMPRTGSTVLEQILATNPDVYAGGERSDIPHLVAQLAREAGTGEPHSRRPYSLPEQARTCAEQLLATLKTVSGGSRYVTIKTLENFPHLGLLGTLFPNAKIIYCTRDPLDVCVSCYFQNFSSVDFSWDLQDIAAYYKSYVQLESHWAQVLPMSMHCVRYEELLRQPEQVTRALFDYCGLPWDQNCLKFFENRGSVRTASTVQVRKPLTTRPIGRWQRYRAHLGLLFTALDITEPDTFVSNHPYIRAASDDADIMNMRG